MGGGLETGIGCAEADRGEGVVVGGGLSRRRGEPEMEGEGWRAV